MERRRVQEVGGGTVTVSLPHEWAKAHDVTSGTSVFLRPHADGVLELLIDPADADATETASIDPEPLGPAAAERLLRAAYRRGYDRIEVAGEELPGATRAAVERRVRRLTGATITAEDETSIVVAVPMDPDAVSVEQTLASLIDATAAVFEQLSAALDPEGDPRPGVSAGAIQRKADLIARQATGRLVTDPDGPSHPDRSEWRTLGTAVAGAGLAGLRALDRLEGVDEPPRSDPLQEQLRGGIALLEAGGQAVVGEATEPPAALLTRCSKLAAAVDAQTATLQDPTLVEVAVGAQRLLRAARKTSECAAASRFGAED